MFGFLDGSVAADPSFFGNDVFGSVLSVPMLSGKRSFIANGFDYIVRSCKTLFLLCGISLCTEEAQSCFCFLFDLG